MVHPLIVELDGPDGTRLGKVNLNDSNPPATNEEIDRLVRAVYGHGGNYTVKSWRKVTKPNEFEDAQKALAAKYPKRASLDEATGGQPTRSVVDPTVFDTAENKQA